MFRAEPRDEGRVTILFGLERILISSWLVHRDETVAHLGWGLALFQCTHGARDVRKRGKLAVREVFGSGYEA